MLKKIPHAGTVLLAALLLAGCAASGGGGGSATVGAAGSDPTPTVGDPNTEGTVDQPTP